MLLYVPVVQVDTYLSGCTDCTDCTDGEEMAGLDGEEAGHADFTKGKVVMTLPEFADPYKYVKGRFVFAVLEQQNCKHNLEVYINAYKSPAEAEGESK